MPGEKNSGEVLISFPFVFTTPARSRIPGRRIKLKIARKDGKRRRARVPRAIQFFPAAFRRSSASIPSAEGVETGGKFESVPRWRSIDRSTEEFCTNEKWKLLANIQINFSPFARDGLTPGSFDPLPSNYSLLRIYGSPTTMAPSVSRPRGPDYSTTPFFFIIVPEVFPTFCPS